MKNILVPFIVFSILFISLQSKGQFTYPKAKADENPLSKRTELRGNSEIYLVYDSIDQNTNNYIVNQQIIDYSYTTASNWDWKPSVQNNTRNYSNRHFALAKGDFNGDFKDDVIQAWQGPNRNIYLNIPSINTSSLTLSQGADYTITGSPLNSLNTGTPEYVGRIRIATADFDGDYLSEFVVAYRNESDGLLHIEIYDVDSATFTISLITSIADESLPLNSNPNHECFDIAVKDLDADGIPEIVAAYGQPVVGMTGIWNKIYKYNKSTSTLSAKAKQILDTANIGLSDQVNISVACGDFNGDIVGEILTIFGRQIPNNVSNPDTWMMIARPADDSSFTPSTIDYLESLVVEPNILGRTYSVNNLETFSIAVGDIDKNGKDDFVVGLSNSFDAYKMDASFNFIVIDSSGSVGIAPNYTGQEFENYIALGDLNYDGKLDVINIRNTVQTQATNTQEFYIHAHELLSNNHFSKIADLSGVLSNSSGNFNFVRNFGIITGDFNGDRATLGRGTSYTVYGVVQPLVRLGAVPIHFDVIDSAGQQIIYDVCNCFPLPTVSNCNFTSRYKETANQTVTFESRHNSDWSVGASLSLGGSFGVVNVSAELEATYGQKFGSTQSATKNTTLTQEVNAVYDDKYISTVAKYIVNEYPVYAGDTLVTYVASFVPVTVVDKLISASDVDYISGTVAQHQPGNIFSYRPIGAPFEADRLLSTAAISVNISQNTTASPTEFNQGQANLTQAQREQDFNLSTSASAGAFGQSIGMKGSYGFSDVSTQSATVTTDFGFQMSYGSRGPQGADYSVYPYFGWGTDGALKLDFQVDPSAFGWPIIYPNPDPALLLPMLRYTEMGYTFAPGTSFYRNRTKSMVVSNRAPNIGDTLTFTASVFNMSPHDMQSGAEVSFYYGDPDNGGTIISNTQGQTTISTTAIAKQDADTLTFDFVFTPPVNQTDRRYFIKIDPSNTFPAESHEDNNKGWIEMDSGFVMVGIDEIAGPELNPYFSVWPSGENPVDDAAVVRLEIHKTARVMMNLYDIRGKKLEEVTNRVYSPGNYLQGVITTDLPDGVYLLNTVCEGRSETQKIVVYH